MYIKIDKKRFFIIYSNSKALELNVESTTALHFVEEFVHYSGLSRDELAYYIPRPIIDQYQHLSAEQA